MKRRNYIAMMLTLPFAKLSAEPERRVFYVDPGDLDSKEAKEFFNKVIKTYKNHPITFKVEECIGKYDETYAINDEQRKDVIDNFILLRRNNGRT